MPNSLFLVTGMSGTGVRGSLETYKKEFGGEIVALEDDLVRRVTTAEPLRRLIEAEDSSLEGKADLELQDVLYLPWPILLEEWRKAVKDTISRAAAALKSDDVFLTFHAAWYPSELEGFASPVDMRELITLVETVGRPQRFVTLIDDIFDCYVRLSRENGVFEQYSDRLAKKLEAHMDILRWREAEVRFSQQIATSIGIPQDFFVFAVKHPLRTFRRLLTLSAPKRVYIAHPISAPRRRGMQTEWSEGLLNEITEVAAQLRDEEDVVLFEPTTIDELRLNPKNPDLASEPSPVWPRPEEKALWTPLDSEIERREANDPFLVLDSVNAAKGLEPFRRPTRAEDEELRSAARLLLREVSHQVNWRDRLLVEQGTVLVQLRPFAQGVASRSVLAEYLLHVNLRRAYASNRPPAIVYHPPEDDWERRVEIALHAADSAIEGFRFFPDEEEELRRAVASDLRMKLSQLLEIGDDQKLGSEFERIVTARNGRGITVPEQTSSLGGRRSSQLLAQRRRLVGRAIKDLSMEDAELPPTLNLKLYDPNNEADLRLERLPSAEIAHWVVDMVRTSFRPTVGAKNGPKKDA